MPFFTIAIHASSSNLPRKRVIEFSLIGFNSVNRYSGSVAYINVSNSCNKGSAASSPESLRKFLLERCEREYNRVVGVIASLKAHSGLNDSSKHDQYAGWQLRHGQQLKKHPSASNCD
jgi:hypothetical protein